MKRILAASALLIALGAGCVQTPPATPSPAPSTAPTGAAPAAPAPTPSAAAPVDVTNINPGESVHPIDQGKEITSDAFRYKLLDVRKDGNVYLVKAEVQNITNMTLNVSTAVSFLSDKDTLVTGGYHPFVVDFLYPRSNVGVNLNVYQDLQPNQTVSGYFLFNVEDTYQPGKQYFVILNRGYDRAQNKMTGKNGLTTAGAFKVR